MDRLHPPCDPAANAEVRGSDCGETWETGMVRAKLGGLAGVSGLVLAGLGVVVSIAAGAPLRLVFRALHFGVFISTCRSCCS